MKKVIAGVVCMTGALFAHAEGLLVANGPWEMEQATKPGVWLPARVPGTVLQTLVENKIVPEPYYGLNNKSELGLIPDLRDNRDFYTVTYRTKVAIPADWEGRKVFMRPEGINYRGEIRLGIGRGQTPLTENC